jgi:hypothetical protein
MARLARTRREKNIFLQQQRQQRLFMYTGKVFWDLCVGGVVSENIKKNQ